MVGCSSKTFVHYEYMDYVEVVEEEIVGPNEAYKKYASYSNYIAKRKISTDEYVDVDVGQFYDVMHNKKLDTSKGVTCASKQIIKSKGKQKILVIPVDFPDYKVDKLGISKEDYILNLKKAFFGVAKDNNFLSVAEYYNHSSGGRLQIDGEVCEEFFTYPRTVEEINKDKNTIKSKDVYLQYSDILRWYKTTFNRDYDDFRIDPNSGSNDPAIVEDVVIYLVYTYPHQYADDEGKDNSEFFWAYTFEDKPLSWSSYSTANAIKGKPDAHTFIHEVGHLLGLVDYYPKTNNNSTTTSTVAEPTGRIDMMDFSIGDHTALSKMMLNWTRPYHVLKDCEITINSFTKSGDLVLINHAWNKSVFDEYYLIELYSPLGLNYYDSVIGNKEAILPSLPGIKIYHVDARLAYFTKGDNPLFSHYCYEKGDVSEKKINLANNNTLSSSDTDSGNVRDDYLYELILNHVGHPAASCASNYNLFRKGDSYETTKWNRDLYGTNFKVTVTSCDYNKATLKFEFL